MLQTDAAAAMPRNSNQTATDVGIRTAALRPETSCRARPAPRSRPVREDSESNGPEPTDSSCPNGTSAANSGSAQRSGSRSSRIASAITNGAAAAIQSQLVMIVP